MIPSYQKTPHWPWSLTKHRDDHLHRDPQHFVGKEVIITEKMDGGITQFAGGRVFARSSNAPTHEQWFNYVKSVTLPKLYAVPPHLMPIGEDLYGVHSIEYDPLPDTFFLFHVQDREIKNIGTERTENDRFLSWAAVKEFAEKYGLRTVPELFVGKFDSVEDITKWFMDHIGQPSTYGPVCEGFVMRIATSFAFDTFSRDVCKFVRANHVQTDEHWTRHWKPAKLTKAE